MKKEEYLKKLKYQLLDLPGEDLAQIEDYYLELIYDGMDQGFTEEEILARFESPEEVAERIRSEYGGLVVYTAKGKSKEKQKEFEASEMIHTIRVETENLSIRVKSVEQGPVRVLYKPKDGQDYVEYEERDGIFRFSHHRRDSGLSFNWLNMFWDFQILVLEIPMDFAGNLWLKNSNGTIRVSGLLGLETAEISSGNGKICCANSCAQCMRIQAGNAKIELNNVRGETLFATAGNGIITAKECRFTENITLNTQNGAINGRNLISDHIEMRTCNGLICATVIGNINDYSIDSNTKNGFNNLENIFDPARSKSLTARTHNGRIQVEFAM